MAAYNKFNQFAEDVIRGKHNFASDVFKVLLTNTAPAATDAVKADLVETSGSGYPAGGVAVSLVVSIAGGVAEVAASGDAVFTASGGTIGPFRYAAIYNSTYAAGPLVAWWDYGTSVTLADTEQFTVRFDAINGIFQIS